MRIAILNPQRLVMSLGIAACLFLTLAPPLAARSNPGVPFIVEGEDYVAFNDLGGYAIQPVECNAASHDSIVQGLDRPGEWIELSVPFVESGFYNVEVGIQGLAELSYELRATLFGAGPAGEDWRIELQYVGAGIG